MISLDFLRKTRVFAEFGRISVCRDALGPRCGAARFMPRLMPLCLFSLALLLALVPLQARAQSAQQSAQQAGQQSGQQAQSPAWPARTVRMIVPFPPGGSADLLGRAVAQKMTENLGQSVVVENRPGVDTIVGMEAIARAAPDGHTLGYVIGSALTMNPTLYSKLPYDAQKDFTPVSMLASVPLAIVVHPGLPVNNAQELGAYVKANPNKVFYGSGNIISKIAIEQFLRVSGGRMTEIAYKGSSPTIQDLLRGELQLSVEPIVGILSHVKAGKMRAIAVTNLQRSNAVPEIPTLAESGFPGFDVANWHGMVLPSATPRETVARVVAEVTRAARAPEVAARMAPLSIDLIVSRPEEMQARVNAERERYARDIRALGIKLD